MVKLFHLTPARWRILASISSHIGQAVTLFSLAALFVPETVGLTRDFSKIFASRTLIAGLLLLVAAVIMTREKD